MSKLKKFVNRLRWNWVKILIVAVVLFVAMIVVSANGVGSDNTLQIVLFLASCLVAIFALIGFFAMVFEKLDVLGKNIAKGAKKFGQSASKAFGSGNKAKKKTSNKGDDIVTLTSANGEEIDFVEIAGIAYRGNFYAILQPVELLDGMDDDEALVFKVTRGRNGEDSFNIELDDAIIDAVFKEYNKLLDQQR